MSIVVVGSLNMDLVVRCKQLPVAGETVHGTGTAQVPGGKGANQAAAAARLGIQTAMVGCVGNDSFGHTLKQSLTTVGVDVSAVQSSPRTTTGLALITVEDSGQNTIIVDAGANNILSPADIERATPQIAAASLLLLQLEVPLTVVQAGIRIARQSNVRVLLNPAPVPTIASLPDEIWQADWLCPNESEAAKLTGINVNSAATAIDAAAALAKRNSGSVLVTLGHRGVLLATPTVCLHASAFKIRAVDATAAGDAFAAAFAVALAEGCTNSEAIRFASAAGAIAASRPGASTSLPARADVEQLLDQQPHAAHLQPAHTANFWNP